MPPKSGMPDAEKRPGAMPPGPLAPPTDEFAPYQMGNHGLYDVTPACTSSAVRARTSSMSVCRPRAVPQTTA